MPTRPDIRSTVQATHTMRFYTLDKNGKPNSKIRQAYVHLEGGDDHAWEWQHTETYGSHFKRVPGYEALPGGGRSHDRLKVLGYTKIRKQGTIKAKGLGA
jgi:hypothetical protein